MSNNTIPIWTYTMPIELGGLRIEFYSRNDLLIYYGDLCADCGSDSLKTVAKQHLCGRLEDALKGWLAVSNEVKK